MRVALRLALRHPWRLAAAGAALAVGTACVLLQPLASGLFLESLMPGAGSSAGALTILGPRHRALFALGAAYVLEPLATGVYVRQMSFVGEAVVASLRDVYFRALLAQRVEFFDRHQVAELTTVLSSDFGALRDMFCANLSRDRGLRAVAEVLGAVSVLFCLSPQLAPVLVTIVLFAAVNAALYARSTKLLFVADSAQAAQLVDAADQALSSMRTVKSFAAEPAERVRFASRVEGLRATGRRLGGAKSILEASNRLAIYASLMVLYLYGGFLVKGGFMPLRVLLSSIGFTFSLIFCTQGLVNTFADVRRAISSLARVQALVGSGRPEADLVDLLGAGPSGRLSGAEAVGAVQKTELACRAGDAAVLAARQDGLTLRIESFAYPTRPEAPVLRDIELHLKKGTTTALVGPSGAGKSTVVQILARFYDLSDGDMALGERSAEDFTRHEWARAVSVVTQEPVLFNGTVAENIAYGGCGTWSRVDVERAAQAANAHEFIRKLPEGYDTVLGEGGDIQLSGGQRQRVAIARALLKDAPGAGQHVRGRTARH
jgi:ATP-binding cassette subfamily B (MDR/TAP) protein 8